MPNQRQTIATALADFQNYQLKEAAIALFSTLGYRSDKTIDLDGSLADLQANFDPNGLLKEDNALISCWKSVHLLFQLTSDEVLQGSQGVLQLDECTELDRKLVKSCIFFALELKGPTPTRSDLSRITRSLNRLLPIPILVLFKHKTNISLAVVNRRRNMRDGTRDVLTRISFIRNIDCVAPHRAHLDLLERFSLPVLSREHGTIRTFAQLDDAWQKLLSTQELNQRFYRELVNWFRWATSEIRLAYLPYHVEDTPASRARATQEFTVRLICRTLFAWFLKEMRLIPNCLLELYDATDQPRRLTTGPSICGFACQVVDALQ